jgi:NitT/TauT family transport system substrate-binding protein
MRARVIAALLAFVIVAIAGADGPGAWGQSRLIPRLPAPVTVKVGGATGSMSSAGYFVALHKGYFKEANIVNEWVDLQSHTQLLPPLATGEIDVGSMGPSAALFNALTRGVKLRIVADQNTAYPGRSSIAVLVRKDLIESGQFKTPADLKGRTFALVTRHGTMELDFHKVLRMGRLAPDDVKLVVMPFPQMNAGFATKTIDAAISLEPLVNAAVTQGFAVRWKGLDEITPNRQNGFLAMSEAFASKTDVARAWIVAYVRGLRDYNDATVKKMGREDVVRALIANTPVKDPAMYERMVLPGIDPNGEVRAQYTREAYEELKAAGVVKGDVDLDKVIDLSFVRYAQEVLGPYSR